MPKTNSFRLDKGVTVLLEDLSNNLKTSKTDIVEKSILFFADKFKKSQKNKLAKYAGIMSEKELKEFEKIVDRKSIKKPLDIE